MPFIPNLDCLIERTEETSDRYGQAVVRTVRKKGECAIVRLSVGSKKTAVRADSSASRGNAQETVADARLLFPADTEIEVDFVVTVWGARLVVRRVDPRVSMDGELDHYQVDLDAWPE